MAGDQRSFRGVWSDGTTIWIGDNSEDRLWAYDLATGKRDPGSDFNIPRATGISWIRNIWSDGAIMWVADGLDVKLYAYNMPGNADLSGLSISDGTLEPAFHRVTTSYAASAPGGVSSITLTATASDAANATVEFLDGDDLTLADADGATAGHQVDLALGENTIKIKVTAGDGMTTRTYTLVMIRAEQNTGLSDLRVNGVSVPGFDSDVEYTSGYGARLAVQHGVAASVTQATIEGVADDPDASVAYLGADADDAADGHQVNLSEGRNKTSIEVVAADGVTTRTYRLSVNRGSDAPFGWRAQDDFDNLLRAGNRAPQGLWSDGTTMWVSDDRQMFEKLYAYAQDTGLRDPDKDFDTLAEVWNRSIRGIWSDNTTMWVADWYGFKLFAYAMDTTQPDSSKDIDGLGHYGNDWPEDMWSDGETLWVVDGNDPNIYAYRLATGVRDSAKDFTVSGDQLVPSGIWSDGTTIWIGDYRGDKIYAYDLATGKRDPGSDFNTPKAVGNNYVNSIWSDGTVMWVADGVDSKIYAYNMPGNAYLSGLSLSDGTLEPAFNRGTNSYTASVEYAQSQITLIATASDTDNATVEFLDGDDLTLADADGAAAGHQVDLAVGENTIKIKVAAGDGLTTRTYTLVVTHDEPNTDLSDLRVNGVSVPGFASDVEYTPDGVQHGVAASVTQATIEGVADDPDASVTYVGADADDVTEGHQMNLSEGRNEVSIVVAAANGIRTRTYVLSVNRGSDAPFGWRAQDDFDTLLAAGVTDLEGLWSDGATMWVADDRDPLERLFAFALDTKLRDPGKDFDTLAAVWNTIVRGIWSDGATMWVAEEYYAKLYAYAMDTRQRDSGKDFNNLGQYGNHDPEDIWSDGETIWVADKRDSKLFAYRLATRQRDSAKDFTVADDQPSSKGVWSDGTTVWIGDNSEYKLWAYDLASGMRDPGSDFNTPKAAGNTWVRYIWSDGTVMWVSDGVDGKLYAYNMPGNADLGGLSLSAVTLEPAFHRVTTSYLALVPSDVSSITVTAPASDAGQATVEFLDASDRTLADADPNTPGHQVALAPGESTVTVIKVRVTAEDGATARTYTLSVSRQRPLEVSFGSSAYRVAEGFSVTVTVDLDRTTEREVAVPLVVTAGSGVSDADYSGVPENVVFAPGSSSATFRFKAEIDGVAEADEVVTVSFGTLPEGVIAGSPTTTTVTIADDDDTNAVPVFPRPSPSRSVDENSAAGVAVGAPVTATDADGDRLSYALSGAGATAFRIDAASGQLRTVSGVDYDHEAAGRYPLTVTADDSRGGVAHASVTIHVNDLDEPPPSPAAPTVAPTVGESDSLEVSWIAPDARGRPALSGYELRYRAGSGAWAGRNHAGTGILATLDRLESDTRYEVQVRAHNHEGTERLVAVGRGLDQLAGRRLRGRRPGTDRDQGQRRADRGPLDDGRLLRPLRHPRVGRRRDPDAGPGRPRQRPAAPRWPSRSARCPPGATGSSATPSRIRPTSTATVSTISPSSTAWAA